MTLRRIQVARPGCRVKHSGFPLLGCVFCLLALPASRFSPDATAALASTNDLATAPVEEVVFHAIRYGSTPEKRLWKEAAREEVFRRGTNALEWLVQHGWIDNIMLHVLCEEVVSRTPTNQAVPVLLAALNSDQAPVRRLAVYFLGFFETPEHAARLLPLLQDEETAGAAIRTLGKWRVRSAVSEIVPFLQNPKEARRIGAINALRDMGDSAAVPPLIVALDDQFFTVRETAARALLALGPPAEAAMVRAVSTAQGRQLRALIRALAQCPGRRAGRAIRACLKHPDPEVRAEAERALAPR